MVTLLSSLTIVSSDRAAMRVRAIGSMRQKLVARIGDQIELAKATETGQGFQRVKYRRVRDQETEEVSEKVVKTRVRPWWSVDQDGSILLWIKYGNTNLELAKGRAAIRVGGMEDLIPTLEKVRDAVRAGEFDKLIEGAVTGFKARFGRS